LPCFVVKSRLCRARRLSVSAVTFQNSKKGETGCKGMTNIFNFQINLKKNFNKMLIH